MFPWTRKLLTHYRLLLLVAISMGVYFNTVGNDFVFDDNMQIADNRTIESWRYVPSYFTTHVWDFMYKDDWKGNYYRPVFVVWMRLNHALFGVWPPGWHLTTMLMHGLATLLVFFLGRRVAEDAQVAMWAALLFAVHPIHTESVAWISGVTEPLLAVPFLGCLLFYLRFRESGRRLDMAASLFCAALAVFAKETGIVLPAILFLLAFALANVPLRQRVWEGVRAAVPYVPLMLFYLVARYNALDGLSNSVSDAYNKVDRITELLTIPSVALFYIRMLVWPTGMALFHEHPFITQPTSLAFVLPLIVCVAVVTVALFLGLRFRTPALALPTTILPILPPLFALGSLGVYDLAHDRYLYVPSVGFCILAAAGLKWAAQRYQFAAWQPGAAVAVVAVIFSAMTLLQNTKWRDNYTIWQHAAWVSPSNPKPWTQLGATYMSERRHREAIPYLVKARELDPMQWRSNYVLGIAYFELQEWEQAQRYFRHAIAIAPGTKDVKNSYQYYYLGRALMRTGKYEEAEAALKKAISIRANGLGYHFALGYLLREQGRYAEARAAFLRESELFANTNAQLAVADLDRRMKAPAARN